MKRVQQGFTLIELMIVVAIVGILAAIALPAYQDYIIRSKMSETEAAIAACKTSVAEYVSSHSAFPNKTNSGCSDTGSQYVAAGSLNFGANMFNYTSINTGAATECTLTLTATGYNGGGEIPQWNGSAQACPAKYVPSSFR